MGEEFASEDRKSYSGSYLLGRMKMQRNFVREMNYKGARVKIIAEALMPCLPGRREIFREAKAFLCYFEDLPFEKSDGTTSTISGFTVIGDYPWKKLEQWVECPLESVDSEWDETDLFSKSPDEAVTAKIKDLEEIWLCTSLHTLCQFCKARGEQCKSQLNSLRPFEFRGYRIL